MYGDRSLFEGRYFFTLTAALFERITAAAGYCTISLGRRTSLREGDDSYAPKPHVPPAASYYCSEHPTLCTRLVDDQI
jgi:hypothetical protein